MQPVASRSFGGKARRRSCTSGTARAPDNEKIRTLEAIKTLLREFEDGDLVPLAPGGGRGREREREGRGERGKRASERARERERERERARERERERRERRKRER